MSSYGFDSAYYDAEDRLVSWKRSDSNQDQSWNLSAVGDWTQFTENSTAESRTHGPAHEVTAVGSTPIQHDDKGNQTIDRKGQLMRWDQDNKLHSIDTDGDGTVDVTQAFDALGRRVSRTENGVTTVFVQVGQQTIADYAVGAGPDHPTYRYVYGSYVDEPVVRLDNSGELNYYHRNQQYSIVGLTNSSGGPVERYAYTAYGKPTILAADATTELDESAVENRYLYTGREWDPATGLYHYRARMYEPADGRFLSSPNYSFSRKQKGSLLRLSCKRPKAFDPTRRPQVSLHDAQSFVLGFFRNKPIEVEQVQENFSSDTGLLAFARLDQKLNWTNSFARQIHDTRSGPQHSALSILRQRVFGFIAGDEDQKDHDSLRSHPIFKIIAERNPEKRNLASQPLPHTRKQGKLNEPLLTSITKPIVGRWHVIWWLNAKSMPKGPTVVQ